MHVLYKRVCPSEQKKVLIYSCTQLFLYTFWCLLIILWIYIYIYMCVCVYKNLKEKFYSMKETSMWWSAIRKILNNYVNDCKLFIYYGD